MLWEGKNSAWLGGTPYVESRGEIYPDRCSLDNIKTVRRFLQKMLVSLDKREKEIRERLITLKKDMYETEKMLHPFFKEKASEESKKEVEEKVVGIRERLKQSLALESDDYEQEYVCPRIFARKKKQTE